MTILARNNGIAEPLGRSFILKTNMPKTTIEQSLKLLIEKDYIYADKNGKIYVLDPLIKTVLSADISEEEPYST